MLKPQQRRANGLIPRLMTAMEEASRSETARSFTGKQESFGWLLRRYRLAAGLTQEDLAERAGLSVGGLSALESGKRQTPYRHTVTLLAQALGLTPSEAATLEAAVSRVRAPVSTVLPWRQARMQRQVGVC
jgi:DNA-binding XRE family transcriptional regulator